LYVWRLTAGMATKAMTAASAMLTIPNMNRLFNFIFVFSPVSFIIFMCLYTFKK
jgi:hypothetical protein